MFLKKGVLKIYSKFTGEHPSRSVISIKLLSHVNLLHIFRTPFPKNTSGWLLLLSLVLQCRFVTQIILINDLDNIIMITVMYWYHYHICKKQERFQENEQIV